MDLSLALEVLGEAGPSREHDGLLSLALVPVLSGQNSSLPTPLELRQVRFRCHTAVHLQVQPEHSTSTQATRSAKPPLHSVGDPMGTVLGIDLGTDEERWRVP